MPDLAWTIVVGLLTSFIGGILASLIVLCRHEHDLKRVYARQIWSDFYVAVSALYSHSHSVIDTIDSNIVADIRLSVSDEQSIRDFKARLLSWKNSDDLREKIHKCDKQSLVTVLAWLTKEATDEQGKFRQLFASYPIQVSYFGKSYEAKIWLDAIFTIPEINLASIDPNALEGYAGSLVAMIPDTIQRLRNAYSDVERSFPDAPRPGATR